MWRKVLTTIIITATIVTLVVTQKHTPAKADNITWQKGWTWNNTVLNNGPRSEIANEIRTLRLDWACYCDPDRSNCGNGKGGWSCFGPTETPYVLTTDNKHRQFSVLSEHGPMSHDPVDPIGEEIAYGMQHTQMFYSGSPFSAVGISHSTLIKVPSVDSSGKITLTTKNLCDITNGKYLGVPGGQGGDADLSNRHGVASTLGHCVNFNEPTDFSLSGCTSYFFSAAAFDRRIPAFGVDHGANNKLYAPVVGDPLVDVSRAGYVLGEDNRIILPESFGVTDENKKVWAEFGTFSRDRTILIDQEAEIADFVYNNRSFGFRIGNSIKSGSNVVMYISSDSSDEPLIIQVPPLKLYNRSDTHSVRYRYAVGVASRRLGKYFVAYTGERTVPVSSTVSITIPDITVPKEYIVPGEELTVRGVVVGDRGDTSMVAIEEIYVQDGNCGSAALDRFGWRIESFAKDRAHREEDMLGFLPVVHSLYASYVIPCDGHKRGDWAISYVRYVGDVAQASVKFVPISLSISGSTDVKLSMNILGAKQFWPNGSSFVTSADVPLYPLIQFSPQLTVTYTITDTSGREITGIASPNLYEVRGVAQVDFNDGVWYFGTRLGSEIGDRVIRFGSFDSPYTISLATYRERGTLSCQTGYTNDICNCIAFNIADCYHAPSNNRVEVNGAIRVRARATIPLPDGTVINAWSPWTTPINLHWEALLQQERR